MIEYKLLKKDYETITNQPNDDIFEPKGEKDICPYKEGPTANNLYKK